jgi:hypothetical protein
MKNVVPLVRRPGESVAERSDLVVVGEFRNDTAGDMRLYLELVPEELIMAPGHEITLLARASADLLPIHVAVVNDGLQIHARKEFDPDWHVRFRGKLIKAGTPTRLADHE